MGIKRSELYYFRRDLGISQEYMAKVIGIMPYTYRNKETGKSEFTLSEARKVADILNITIDELYEKMEGNNV